MFKWIKSLFCKKKPTPQPVYEHAPGVDEAASMPLGKYVDMREPYRGDLEQ